jgi:hypothetical protein
MMGNLARTDAYYDPFSDSAVTPPEPQQDPRMFTSDWARQAAAYPQSFEPNVGMFPTPKQPKPAEEAPNPLVPFSAWRSNPPRQTAGTIAADLQNPVSPLGMGLLASGPLRGVAWGLGASMEPSEAEAKIGERIKVPKGPVRAGSSVLGDILVSRGPSRGALTAEDFVSPVSPAAPQIKSLPNTFADPKLRAKAEKLWETYPQYAEQYPDVGPPALMEKRPDPNKPGAYLSAKPLREVPYTSFEEAAKLDATPQYFFEKRLLPEAEQFQKDRNTVQREMDLHGYQPYFDPAKRADVSGYGPFPDTVTAAAPKTLPTMQKFYDMYGTPAARERLQAGFEKGQTIPDTDRWYHMKQLEDEYIKELGPQAGRDAFQKEFAGMMAATTGGASPYNNFLMSHYANYLNKQGATDVAQRAYEMPFPIGGRFASGNMKQAQKYIEGGMQPFDPAQNPKRTDFMNAYLGNRSAGTIDEQMFGAIMPGQTIPEWYGPATRVLHEEAARAGVDPRGFQDVAWAGLKSLGEEQAAAAAAAKRAKANPGIGHNSEPFQFDYEGPMINTINRSIETTHRLTGMPREEIVRRGLIRKEIPMYGIPAAVMGGLAAQDNYQPEEKM